MSKIELKQFLGIRPTMSTDKLGTFEAQTANNCKIRSGSLDILNADLPSATVNQFSFTDGFGTWTLSGTTFKLNGGAISQTAPAAPTVTAANAFLPTAITSGTFSVSATAPLGTPGTAVSGSPAYTQTSFTLNGNRLTVVYTLQPMYLGLTTTNVTYPFTVFAQNAAVTINGSSLSAVGSSVALSGGVGTIKVENIEMSPATVTWKLPPGGTAYTAYVSEWTATFEFTINYTSDLAIERAVVYRLTTVTDSGTGQLESPASDVTSLVALQPNQYAVLTGLPSAGIKRLYRAAGTELDAKYYFVAEVPDGTATYNDLVADADLGEVMPAIENPPATMTQVVWLPGGFCAGFYGKDIYFSDAFMLYSWPSRYTLTTQKTIVGLAVSGNDLIVLSEPPTAPDTDAKNYILTGVAPEVMTMAELMVNEGCSSRNSICKVGQLVGFAAPDGYVLITGGTGKNITEPFYNRSQWSALTPANMIAKEYDSQIVLFTTASPAAGIIIDYLNNTVRTFSAGGSGAFTWKSKVFDSDQPVEMHVAKIEGATGTHTLTLWADGVSVYSGSVTAGTDLALTRGMVAGRSWELQVSGSTRIDSVDLIHRERIVVSGPVRLTQANTEGSWRRLQFQFPDAGRFKVIRARASDYNVTAAFYRDTTLDNTETITGDTDVRLTNQTDNDLWEVDITASGKEVYELLLVPRQVETVTGPVFLKNQASWKGKLFQFPESGYFKVGRVRGSDGAITGTLKFYVDEAVAATKTVNITTDADFRITGMSAAQLIEVEFTPTDQTMQVDEIMLMPRQVQTVSGPVAIPGANRPTWRGMVFHFPETGTFKVLRVRGASGSITATVNIYANEAVAVTKTIAVTNDTDIRITGLDANELFEVEIESSDAIDEVMLIPRQVQAVTGPVFLGKRASWKGMLFQFPESGYFKVGRVRGKAGVVTGTLNFYVDEANAATKSVAVTTDADFRITGMSASQLVEVEFVPTDSTIETDEIMLIPRTVQQVTGPVVMSGANRPTWRGNVFQFPETGTFKVLRVRGAKGAITATVNIYANESDVATKTINVADDTDIRITELSANELFEVEIESSNAIDEVVLIPRQVQTVTGPIFLNKRLSWKGMLFQFPESGYFKVGRVRGKAGTVTGSLKFYVDEANAATKTVNITTDADFRITGMSASQLIEVEFTPTDSTIETDEIMLIPRTVQQITGPIVLSGQNRPSWLGNVFQFPDTGTFKVARVRSPGGTVSATLNLYADEAVTATRSVALTSDTDVRLDLLAPNELWEFDLTGVTGSVDELVLIPREVQTISGPVVLSSRNRLSWKGNVFYFPRRGFFKVARVRGNPGATLGTLNLRADESDTVTLATAITNDTDVRLTEQTPGDLWEVEMTGNGDLDEVVLWPQAVQEVNSPVIHVARAMNQSPATWLGQEFRYPEAVRMRSAIVKARTYPVTLTVYCDGTQVTGSPYTVANATEFRLTQPVSAGRVWEFDASVAGVIDSVTLFAEQLIQPQVAAVILKYDGVQGAVSTLAKVVRFAREDYFACARVDASVYPVSLRFYRDGDRNKTHEVTINNRSGVWLPKWQPCRTWEIDAVSSSSVGIIYSVSLAKSMAALKG